MVIVAPVNVEPSLVIALPVIKPLVFAASAGVAIPSVAVTAIAVRLFFIKFIRVSLDH